MQKSEIGETSRRRRKPMFWRENRLLRRRQTDVCIDQLGRRMCVHKRDKRPRQTNQRNLPPLSPCIPPVRQEYAQWPSPMFFVNVFKNRPSHFLVSRLRIQGLALSAVRQFTRARRGQRGEELHWQGPSLEKRAKPSSVARTSSRARKETEIAECELEAGSATTHVNATTCVVVLRVHCKNTLYVCK